MIAARIERAWIRPPSAHAGINCQVRITQVPGGAVTAVQVGSCNGDDAVRQSISDAAYRASPLPAPSDPALFDRDCGCPLPSLPMQSSEYRPDASGRSPAGFVARRCSC